MQTATGTCVTIAILAFACSACLGGPVISPVVTNQPSNSFITKPKTSLQIEVERLSAAGPSEIAALLAIFDRVDDGDYDSMLRVVDGLGLSHAQMEPHLRLKLRAGGCRIQEDAASRVLANNPADAEAQMTLRGLVHKHGPYELSAISDLGKTGTNAWEAVADIVASLAGTNADCWRASAASLRNIGAPTSLYATILEERLNPAILTNAFAGFDDHTRDFRTEAVINEVLRIDPTNTNAQPLLLAIVSRSHNSILLSFAIDDLVTAKAPAGVLKPILLSALTSPDKWNREVAAARLKSLESSSTGSRR